MFAESYAIESIYESIQWHYLSRCPSLLAPDASRKDLRHMITIVIFDDEPRSIANLRSMIERELPNGELATYREASSLSELEAIIAATTRIDILVADIVMPDGQPSGIEVVRRLFPPESGTQIIFTSGYLEQALEVYQTSHLYFLLKPVDPTKLRDALRRARSALTHRQPPMLRIKTRRKEQLINVSTIFYLESSLHRVIIRCRARDVETYAKLDDLQSQLPASFSRCHHSYLVNLAYVSSLDERELRLHDGTVLPVSRRHARQTQRDLLAYLSTCARASL